MPRVLHINDYPPDSLGGAEVMLARTLALLRAAGCDVQTFTRADLPKPSLTPWRYLHNRGACRELQRKLAEFRPDVVHLHNYYHVLSPAILGVLERYKRTTPARVLMTVHDYHLVCPNSGGNWFRRGLCNVEPERLTSWRYLLSRRWDHRGRLYSLLKLMQHVWHYRWHNARRVLDLCLCPSRFMQGVLDRVGVPTRLLPLPNPPAVVNPAPRPATLTLVFAGRIEPEKGLNLFLEQWPADEGNLLVIGDGSERARVEATVARRGLQTRVSLLGRQSHATTMQHIAAAHVLIQPSLLFENYPLALIEALSVGTNVLVADYGGMREMVQDSGVGYAFQPHEPATLTTAWTALRHAFQQGTLNTFDVRGFLAARDEGTYRDTLLRLYEGRPA